MTDESKPFREQTKSPVPSHRAMAYAIAVRVLDARSQSRPTTPVRHPTSGQFRAKRGGRRGS